MGSRLGREQANLLPDADENFHGRAGFSEEVLVEGHFALWEDGDDGRAWERNEPSSASEGGGEGGGGGGEARGGGD